MDKNYIYYYVLAYWMSFEQNKTKQDQKQIGSIKDEKSKKVLGLNMQNI